MDVDSSSRNKRAGSIIRLLCAVLILYAAQGCASTQLSKNQTEAEFQSPVVAESPQDPHAVANAYDLKEIESRGPGSRFTIAEAKSAEAANISGYFTLRQVDSNSYSYKREFKDDVVYLDMKGLFGAGKGAQKLEIGKESEFSYYDDNPSDHHLPFQAISIIRFEGKIEIAGYVFFGEGTSDNRLTFALVDNMGLIYLRGKGKVLFSNGNEVKLGE